MPSRSITLKSPRDQRDPDREVEANHNVTVPHKAHRAVRQSAVFFTASAGPGEMIVGTQDELLENWRPARAGETFLEIDPLG